MKPVVDFSKCILKRGLISEQALSAYTDYLQKWTSRD